MASHAIPIWRLSRPTLGLVFGLRLCQAEGFLKSVLRLIGLDLAVPDHTTLSRLENKW